MVCVVVCLFGAKRGVVCLCGVVKRLLCAYDVGCMFCGGSGVFVWCSVFVVCVAMFFGVVW